MSKQATTSTPVAAPAPIAAAQPVYLLTNINPKAPNSMSRARFALYQANPTVQAYIAACVALGQPNAQRNARADIAWDTKHGYISLTKPAS